MKKKIEVGDMVLCVTGAAYEDGVRCYCYVLDVYYQRDKRDFSRIMYKVVKLSPPFYCNEHDTPKHDFLSSEIPADWHIELCQPWDYRAEDIIEDGRKIGYNFIPNRNYDNHINVVIFSNERND